MADLKIGQERSKLKNNAKEGSQDVGEPFFHNKKRSILLSL
jgi:hypothetical protein